MSLDLVAELLAEARAGLALTGAGISAESGIPTFRGKDGLWTKYDPVKVASIDAFMEDPAAYWAVARDRGPAVLGATPNPGHHALAQLEAEGHIVAIATQNTDGLHQVAGSRRVIELHGSGRIVVCLECGARESRADVQQRLQDPLPPRCLTCGGMYIKPAAVFFGEPMPVAAMEEAYALAERADVMLVVGSSLVVYPAADIPVVAARAGAKLIVINAEPTPLDRIAAAVLHGRSGEILPELVMLVASAQHRH